MAVWSIRSWCVPLLVLLLPACGDDGPSGADGSTGSAGSTGSTPSTSTAIDPSAGSTATSDPASTTGAPDPSGSTGSGTDGPDPDTGTSTGSATDSTGTTGEGMATTGDPGNVVYSAIALPGGLDRIRIAKADLDADRCTWVVLVAPPIAGRYPGVTVPPGWSVESVSINDVAAACSSPNPAMFGGEAALDANGTIAFGMIGGSGIYPCTVDIDATFDFQGLLPGIPPTDDMVATEIPVDGC